MWTIPVIPANSSLAILREYSKKPFSEASMMSFSCFWMITLSHPGAGLVKF